MNKIGRRAFCADSPPKFSTIEGNEGEGVFTSAVGSGKVGLCFACVWFGFVDQNTHLYDLDRLD